MLRVAAVLWLAAGCVAAQSLWTVPPTPAASPAAARSVVLDAPAAQRAREQQAPAYVERIYVEARDPDAPRRKAPLEKRFADTLAPPPPPVKSADLFDAKPCMSLPSTWNDLTGFRVPLHGCP
ncbi:MAG: hypothetical protein U1F10_12095 [Burkholderiales bacterium]